MPSRRRPKAKKHRGKDEHLPIGVEDVPDGDFTAGDFIAAKVAKKNMRRRDSRKKKPDEAETPMTLEQFATSLRPNPIFAAPINDPNSEGVGSVDAVTHRVEGDDVIIILELLPGPKFTTVVEVELSMKAITDAFKEEDGSVFYPCFPAYSFSVFTKDLFEMLEVAGITAIFESLKN